MLNSKLTFDFLAGPATIIACGIFTALVKRMEVDDRLSRFLKNYASRYFGTTEGRIQRLRSALTANYEKLPDELKHT